MYVIHKFVEDTKKILKDNLIEEYLFGSFAKNEEIWNSVMIDKLSIDLSQ